MMRRARRDIKFARLGKILFCKILIRHGDGKFQSDAPIEGARKF
ncbi:hypothetical protein CAMGR0001_0736 [Campylobacter gracilis RM3268]|uniref:Uncharacterized protein n=1 Tax=Campylobacter gracilis RM3268 TaxID=553220 RepID=C8PFU4_9BACT|nr:hypothetical protein CAMGR0001_0736 [Campylobacter gracilis RM3268]